MSAEPAFKVRSLTGSVYLPQLLFAVGQGAALPVIALLALELGASTAEAGAIVALRGVGRLLFDLPAGWLVARVGERKAMGLATVALGGITGAIALRPRLYAYGLLVLALGGAWAVWTLARLAFATEAAPVDHRGRVMSMMGGMARIGQSIGPFLGGLALIPFGLTGPFLVHALLAAAAAVALYLSNSTGAEAVPGPMVSTRRIVRDNARVLGTAGVVAVTFQVLRSSRQAIIPLWGDSVGISAGGVSVIFGLSAAIESLVFYPVGRLMDRRGRKWAAIPSMALLSVGIALIPLSSNMTSLTIVGLVIGLANGLGSGINMTLGSDFSPGAGRSQFLGVWRMFSDVGTSVGPLLVAGTTAAVSLGAAAVIVGGVGAAGLLVLWRAVPETLTMERRP